jgi:hypothetical protein
MRVSLSPLIWTRLKVKRIKPSTARRQALDNRDEEIRLRAYQIWERQGRSGSPEESLA